MIPNNPANPAEVLGKIHTPIAYIFGDKDHDVAYYASVQNVGAIRSPVFGAWQDQMTHLGTYGQRDGGFFGTIAVAWLDWQLKGDRRGAALFTGAKCVLCTAPSWHVTKRGMD